MASLSARQHLLFNKSVLVVALLLFSSAPSVLQAAPRQWVIKGGGKLNGEFIEVTSTDVVRIMLKNGEEREIEFDSLSTVDQKFVRTKASGATPASAAAAIPGEKSSSAEDSNQASLKTGTSPDDLGAIKAQAQRCQTADEAVVIYEVFLNNNKLSPAVRAGAGQELAEWQRKANSGIVRFGSKWCTLDEVRAAQVKAFFQIGQGLELVRLNQNELALEKLKEASKTDPESIRADFIIATVYALGSINFKEAAEHYRTCLKRDPTNIAVLNNLALVEIKESKYADAVLHFKAATKERYDERIAQNMGRMLDQAGKRKLAVRKTQLRA